MGLGLEGAFGADALSQALRQQVMDRLAQQQQQFQNTITTRSADRADRALSQQDTLTRLKIQELADQKAATEADQQFKIGTTLSSTIPAGSILPPESPAVKPLQILGQLREQAPTLPSTSFIGTQTTAPQPENPNTSIQGTLRMASNAGNPRQFVKLPSAGQQNVIADNARADAALKNTEAHQQEVFGLQSQNAADRLRYQADVLGLQREKFDAAQNKAPKPLTLSAGAKNSRQAIEQAAPMTDQVLAMMEKEFPGIDKQDGTYNTPADKLGSLYQRGKYLLGFNDPNDPRRQIVNLLQPIQAGQYTRSSRSYKMVELALKHMADMSQTPEAQYARAKELRGLMPEMLEGIVRSETPVDPSNPLAGSYFDPSRQAAPDATAAPAPAPKVERWVRRGGRLVRE